MSDFMFEVGFFGLCYALIFGGIFGAAYKMTEMMLVMIA